MQTTKFDLGMYCMGNGTTVCNRAVQEHGDYKQVAHISEHGVIKLYVPEDYIPQADMERIKKVAQADKQKFMETWNAKSDVEKYAYMYDIPTIGCGYNAFAIIDRDNKNLTLAERVQLMEKVFFETHM